MIVPEGKQYVTSLVAFGPGLTVPPEFEGKGQLVDIPAPLEIPDTVRAEALRRKRDERLTQSDWTQLSDCPLTVQAVAEWQVYRQTLRDIPQQEDFPQAVTWPEAPA